MPASTTAAPSLRAGLRFTTIGQGAALRVVTRCGRELPAGSARRTSPAADLRIRVRPFTAPGTERASRIRLTVTAHGPIELTGAILDLPAPLDGAQLDLYGYQSWSMSGTFPPGTRTEILAAPLRSTPFGSYGDLRMARVDRDLDAPTSHEQLLADDGERIWLAASLIGDEVFTLWQAMGEPGARFARAVLDVEHAQLAPGEERVIADIVVLWAADRIGALHALRVLDGKATQHAPTRAATGNRTAIGSHRAIGDHTAIGDKGGEPSGERGRVSGWCSWYEYYQHIDEPTLLAAVQQMAEGGWPTPAVFQVDDGYQARVGDWLTLREDAFPRGMAPIARAAVNAGLTPGIWVAPFVASATSRLIHDHPDFLARDEKGRRVPAGINAAWGGVFYALDLGNERVLDYLAGVFSTMREQWGYRFFKLDFLYAAALAPPPGLTRAQAMRRAMELLRAWCADAHLLGCGVPLVSAAGLVEHCRIGADVAARWESPIERASGSRERVSTFSSLSSTLTRWWMDGHYFGNDPDVVLLRNWDTKLSEEEVETLFTLNVLLGSLVFCSDDLARYDAGRWRQLRRMWPLPHCEVVSFAVEGAHHLVLEESGVRYALDVNLTDRTHQTAAGTPLAPHASSCRRLPADDDPVLGSASYILPGGEVSRAERVGDELRLTLREGFTGCGTLELRADSSLARITAGGRQLEFTRARSGTIIAHL